MESADFDVTLTRIKITMPRLIMWFDDGRIEPSTEEEKEIERRHIAANDQYRKALNDIYGKGVEVGVYLGTEWVAQEWISEKYRMALALGWDDFKQWSRRLLAEAYAMHKSKEKINNETKDSQS